MAEVTTTHDRLFGGAVSIHQPAKRAGYRVNVDAILLGAFAAGQPTRRVRHAVDLGSGVGAVGLTLLHLGAAARVTMVEIDATLAVLAERNAHENEWSDRIDVRHADAKQAARDLAGAADLVVCNPPYVTPGRGRAPSASVRTAKYGDLGVFVDAARRLAGRRSRVCFVYPANESTTLLGALRSHGLEPKRLRAVHGRADAPARVVLVEAVAGKPGGLAIEAPLVETDEAGRPSIELAALLAR